METILSFIKESRKMKKNSEEIMEEMERKMPEEAKLVESIDLKKGEVVLLLRA